MPYMTNIQEVIDKIVKLAVDKPEFKERLLKNPKEAIEELINFKFPDSFEIAVHEDTPSKLNIILPDSSDELSEIELLAVSGGGGGWLDGGGTVPLFDLIN